MQRLTRTEKIRRVCALAVSLSSSREEDKAYYDPALRGLNPRKAVFGSSYSLSLPKPAGLRRPRPLGTTLKKSADFAEIILELWNMTTSYVYIIYYGGAWTAAQFFFVKGSLVVLGGGHSTPTHGQSSV